MDAARELKMGALSLRIIDLPRLPFNVLDCNGLGHFSFASRLLIISAEDENVVAMNAVEKLTGVAGITNNSAVDA